MLIELFLRHPMPKIVFCVLSLSLSSGLRAHAVEVGDKAYYVISTSVEGETPYASSIQLAVTGRETIDGMPMYQWELAVLARNGETYGVQILSQRVPMTSPAGPGVVARYVYRDAAGRVLDYRDTYTGRALLPEIQFEQSFLPRPAYDAVYDDGFASAGAFLGHVCVRVLELPEPIELSFDDPTVLELRSDLIMGSQVSARRDPEAAENESGKYRPYTREEFDIMVEAGYNLFRNVPDEWVLTSPVFFNAGATFPDSFYRSNWQPGKPYLDEPMVRLGWSGGIPGNPLGPEQVAEALRQRVASKYVLRRREIELTNKVDLGTLDLIAHPRLSWDTQYWSAWYQLAVGAPALVHEGRYVKRGYGWHPEELFGQEGLDDLAFRDQVNCMNGFLRGAARAFDGDWGVSVYPEGDADLRVPAMIQAYEMGARYLWFWAHYPNMSFDIQREVATAVSRHVAENPRGDHQARTDSASLGIAFPPGYVFSWWGTWGMQREELSRAGASYGDISAAGLWEGILASRRGIPFDFLVDEPGIRELGYDRLVIVRKDGSVDVEPPWPAPRAARRLTLSFDEGEVPNVAGRDKGGQDYTVKRAGPIAIDGKLEEWTNADWITLTSEQHGFPDVIDAEATVIYDAKDERWIEQRKSFKGMLGMTFEQITPELEEKYTLEDFQGIGVVVTGVVPDSPADRAGVLEGDVIVDAYGHEIKYRFQMFEKWDWVKNRYDHGDEIPFKLRRSGRYQFGEPGDLGAEVALRVDEDHLYIAARVTDDVHAQHHYAWEMWKGDSLQLGFDPTLERRSDGKYGEEDVEIGFVMKKGRPLAWRYHGRRGDPLGLLSAADVSIVREKGRTIYEAAVPLTELAPMTPDLWPSVGFNVVVNDSDGAIQREGRLELRRPAMTLGKRTAQFATMRFEPSDRRDKVSAALMWRRRATPEGGHFRLIAAAGSPEVRTAEIVAVLESLDSPHTPPVTARMPMTVTAKPAEHSLRVATNSPPGRYRLTVRVETPERELCTQDSLPVYIYPR